MKQITGIITRVTVWDFVRALAGDFSDDARLFLYDYYSDLSEELGEPIEFDPIAINCEWYEYESDTGFIGDMMLDDIEDIHEEVAEHCEGDLYGHYAYRLDNGNLLVLQ